MDGTEKLSCFSFEIRILEAKNIEFKSPKTLFVRYYICAGNNNNNNKRIHLNTKEITSKSNFIWNECFSLECWGADQDSLNQVTLTLELRKAKKLPLVGWRSVIFGSQLLGRAEIPIWNHQANAEIEKWVCLVCEESRFVLKEPKLKVGMRVRVVHNEEIMEMKKRRRFGKWKKKDKYCGCNSGMGHYYCEDQDVFAIAMAASMEFL